MSQTIVEAEPNIVGLAILDTYAVRWSRETAARDVVQNFFDEVDDFAAVTIEIDDAQRRVRVSGPSELHFDYLRYLGATTKRGANRRSAGGFGEGFKICALVLTRDFHCEVVAGSRDWELRAVLRPIRLGRELAYEIRTRVPGAGSYVELRHADKKLRQAFACTRDAFRHPTNPKLAQPMHVDDAAGVGVWRAADEHRGDVFYRRQLRGTLRFPQGAGLTFACDDRIAALEGDRDRRDLADVTTVVAEVCRRLPLEALEKAIRHLRQYWQTGGRALSAMLRVARERGLRMSFPRRWVARQRRGSSLEVVAEKHGAKIGIAALGGVGMPTLLERFSQPMTPREPTAREAWRFHVATQLYRDLAQRPPLLHRLLVVDLSAAARRQLSEGEVCIMPASVLAAPFDEAITACLTAHARSTRGAGRISDADRLTALLEGVMAKPGRLEQARCAWDAPPSPVGSPVPGDGNKITFAVEWYGLATHRPPVVPLLVLAPPGFPPAERLLADLNRLANELHLWLIMSDPPVTCERDAVQHNARGVVTVKIDDREVAPQRGARSSFTLRTYGSPPSLLPDEETLRQALMAAGARAERRRRARRKPRGRRAAARPFLKYLAKVDPTEYVRRSRELAVSDAAAITSWPLGWPSTITCAAMDLAGQALAALPFDEDGLEAAACNAMTEHNVAVAELVRRLIAATPGLADPTCQAAFAAVGDAIWRSVKAGAALVAIEEEVRPLAAALTEVARAGADVPLDEACTSACRSAAVCAAIRARTGGVEDMVQAGLAALAKAITFCQARHEQRDEQGEPPSCYTAHSPLHDHLGLVDRAAPPKAPNPCEEAVRAAWDRALAGGACELEAARAALLACEARAEEVRAAGRSGATAG